MKKSDIICIVGPSCAGKTTAASILSRNDRFTIIAASKYPRKRYSTSQSKLGLLEFVTQEFHDKGMDTFAKELIRDLQEDRSNHSDHKYVIDGFRAPEEVELLSHAVGASHIIAVFADARTRFARNIARDNTASITNYANFIHKDLVEYGFGMSRLMASAEVLIINDNDLKTFENAILSVVG